MNEEKQKNTNEPQLLVCIDCNGTGKRQSKVCSTCQGCGVGLVSPDWLAYWDRRVDNWQIAQDKIKELVQYFINGFLILLGAVGLLVLIRWFFTVSVSQFTNLSFWQQVWQKQGNWTLLFWCSLLGDCYLIFRIIQETKNRKKVAKQESYHKLPLLIKNWSEAKLLSPEVKKEISMTFTPATLKAIQRAWQLAQNWHHSEVNAIHLLAVLISWPKIIIIFNRLDLDLVKLKNKIKRVLNNQSEYVKHPPVISKELRQILLHSYLVAYREHQSQVDLPELAEALAQFKNQAEEILYDLKIDKNKLANVAQWLRVQKILYNNWQKFRRVARWKPKGAMNRAMTAMATPFLDAFSEDLTSLAKCGYLSPCLDRAEEFNKIFRIIEGRNKSLVLVGHPGVGKRTILEGLAQKMVAENVSKILQDKRLVSLSIARLVGGATPAQAGERLLNVIHEIIRSGNIILAVPNIQDLLGITTGQEESLDLSEVLVSALERKSCLCLATATPNDYRHHIEGTALGNILEKIMIPEMSFNQSVQVLEAKTGPLEHKNKIYFSYDAIASAVKMSSRYLSERWLPEKAIGILEEVAIHINHQRGINQIVTREDIAKIIAEKTKVPVTKITEAESKKLLNLEAKIHQRLVDQEPAVQMVAEALRRARTELRDLKRPIVNLLFLGPTGVGKTELAKTVAEIYFGSEENMIRLDMSEYQTVDSIERLIGTPGHQGSGYLTQAVRKQPFALVLLDEIEKAHPDILNIFLQVMEDGRLTDGQGRTINFTNVILIATSNAGTQFIQDNLRIGADIEQIRKRLLEGQLKKHFRPEFLNRFDGVMIFKPLSVADVIKIAHLMLKKVKQKLLQKGITFEATDEAVTELAQEGFDPAYGARPLRRVIQKRVSNSLANYLLQNKIGRRDKVIFEVGGKLRVEKAKEI